MAIDSNPRRFVLTVTEIDCNLLTGGKEKKVDTVELVFAGRVMPATKQRMEKAFKTGNFKLGSKVFT